MPHNLPKIRRMAGLLQTKNYPALKLICIGSSGAIIAGIIASMLTTTPEIFYVRKEGESGHPHDYKDIHKGNLVFVDDFICEGGTVNGIIHYLKSKNIEHITGICLSTSPHNSCVDFSSIEDFFTDILFPS